MSSATDGYEPTGILLQAGFSLEEITTLQKNARTAILNGTRRVSEWDVDNTRSKGYYELTTAQLLIEVQYALEAMNPAAYPSLPSKTQVIFT